VTGRRSPAATGNPRDWLDHETKTAHVYYLRMMARGSVQCVVCGAQRDGGPGHVCAEHTDWRVSGRTPDRGPVEYTHGTDLPNG
jgi:hypothetical protein